MTDRYTYLMGWLRRTVARPRSWFLAAALVLFFGAILFSRTERTVTTEAPTVWNPPVPTLTPCPEPTALTFVCDGQPGFYSSGGTIVTHPLSFRTPIIVGGLAASFVLAGIGLAVDRR